MQGDSTMDSLIKTYSNRPGAADSGWEYEIKMATLLLLRCINQRNTTDAWLAMNVNHCGAFDDIVLYRQTKDGNEVIYLLQLKHEEKGSDIKAEEFKSKKKSPFLLSKYINSICEINNSIARQTTRIEDLQLDDEGEDLVNSIWRNNCKTAYILFTNRGTTTGCTFLKHVSQKSTLDTQWMLYGTLNTTTKGNIFALDFEALRDVYQGDLVDAENFFLVTRQEHVTKLSTALSNAMKNLIQPVELAENSLSDVCLKFLHFMSDWLKGNLGGYYQLTKHQVLKQVIQFLLEPYIVKLADPSTQINVNRTDIWNQITMNSDVTVINQADELTVDFVLGATATIIQQHCKSVDDWWRDNECIVKREVLAPKKTFNHIYHYLWRVKKVPVLLQVCDSKHACQIRDIVKFCRGIFKVVVINKSDSPIEYQNTSNVFLNINNLNDNDRKAILLQSFTLQGRQSSIPLQELVNSSNVAHITTKDVIYILAQKFNIGDKREPFPEFFEETSLSRVWLDISVLWNVSSEMFILKCCDPDILKMLLQKCTIKAPNLSVWLWPNIKKNSEALIIVYKADEDLPRIEHYCLKKEKQFHQLTLHDSTNLEWVKSSGSVTTIQSFRLNSNTTWKPLTKTELITNMITNRKPALVSSDPGMGKSVLIKYISRNVPSDWWTLKLNLADHIDMYTIWETENPSVKLFNSFVNTVLSQKRYISPFAEVVFQQYFEKKHIIFLLDGFDEIPISYQNGAKNLIKFIYQTGYAICLTTRPVLKIELESILNTFSVTLNLFTRSNQENFLKNYFARAANVLTSDKRIISFVNQLLDATKKNLNDYDNLFAGIPLQTVLLAQVFSKNCVKYFETGQFECKHFDLLFLYRHFFHEKLQIARAKVEGVTEDSINQYKICRSFYALQLIFRENDLEELQISQKLLHASEMFPLMMQLIQKDGIIVAEDKTDVNFVHRTFAEFLAAEWLAQNINGKFKVLVQTLVKETFHPSFEVIRNIFDRLLAQSCRLHLAIINRQVSKVQEIIHSDLEVYKERDKGSRTFLHLIASWGQQHTVQKPTSTELLTLVPNDDIIKILKLIPTSELSNNSKDNILNYTPLDYAIFSGALNVANAICARLNNPYYFELVTTLHDWEECMYRMNYYSLLNVFSKLGFSNIVSSQGISYKDTSLGKFCSAIERGDVNFIMAWISQQEYLNVADPDTGYTPLHIAIIYDRPEIATMLLNHKADPTKRDNSGRTPLHWALSRNVEINNTAHQLNIENSTSVAHTTWDDITKTLIDLLSKDKCLDVTDIDHNTALNLAAHNGHINAIKLLPVQGANKEIKNSKGDTPLITSACQGHTDIVDLLLSCGANKEAKNCYGCTALLAAILVGRTEMTGFLLSKDFCVESKDNSGNTALLVAAGIGHVDIVSLLLSHGCNVNAKNKESNTALMLATWNGHVDVVYMLLLHGADINAEGDDGNTALLIAASQGLSDILRLLLLQGADKATRNNKDKVALTIAALYGHIDIIKELLLWDVDKEASDSHGDTALAIAAIHGYASIAHILLLHGCNKETTNKEGKTPLILAARNGHLDIVRLLLSENIDKEAKSHAGFTALAFASRNGHIDVVKLLLFHGVDKETRTEEGRTPLVLAAGSGRCDVVSVLMSSGANLEVKMHNGDTALIRAAANGRTDVIKVLLSHGLNREIANTSLSVTTLAAEKEAKNHFGGTALAVAAAWGHINVVNLLISLEADIESRTIQEATPLILAAWNGHADVVQLLLNQGASMEAKDIYGESALLLAASEGHLEIVKMLLSLGADKNVTNDNGDTVANAAASSGKIDVVNFLLSEDSKNEGEEPCEEGSGAVQSHTNLNDRKKMSCSIS